MATRLANILLLFFAFTVQLPAQQTEADRKLLAEVRAQAEKSDAQFQFELGAAFYFGNLGLAKNAVEAVNWYRKAADQNFAPAQSNLGLCYTKGEGVSKDDVEAVKWYRKAAEQNLAMAQFNLGVCYEFGEGVGTNEVEAVKWYRSAAEQNLALAQFNLGKCYLNGRGVVKDEVEAVKWCGRAAEQNYGGAQYVLGACYANGQGVRKDTVEAVKWYRKAAEQNVDLAQYNLGLMYVRGQGVSQDFSEAMVWFRKAAEQGYASAEFNIGVIYNEGNGMPEVPPIEWTRGGEPEKGKPPCPRKQRQTQNRNERRTILSSRRKPCNWSTAAASRWQRLRASWECLSGSCAIGRTAFNPSWINSLKPLKPCACGCPNWNGTTSSCASNATF